MVLSICDNTNILLIFKIIRKTLLILKIAVPIILIISLSIELLNALTSHDLELLKKSSFNAIKKIIIAIFVFFLPTILKSLISLTPYNNLDCISNEDITNAKELLDKAKELKTNSSYEEAESAIDLLDDSKTKNELTNELEKLFYQMNSNIEQNNIDNKYIQNTLGLPKYDQCDSKWGNISYDTSGDTFCTSSCGYTAFAMIAAGLNKDETITPITVVSKMRNINISEGEKTSLGYGYATKKEINTYATEYNLNYKVIQNSYSSIKEALNEEKALLILVKGHYIVLSPSGKDNTAILLDPYSSWNNIKKKSGEYTLEYIFELYGNPKWVSSYWK